MDYSKVFKDYRYQPRDEWGQWRREILPVTDRIIIDHKEDQSRHLVRSGTGAGLLLV